MKIKKCKDMIGNQTVFIRFLCNTFLVLMIPFLILSTVYFSLNARLQEQAYERNLGILENSVEKMELLYDNMDQISFWLSENPEIVRYYNTDHTSINTQTTSMLQAQEVLAAIRVGNSDIQNIQLYSRESDTLIDFYTNAFYVERYYGSSFLVQGMDSFGFRNRYLDAPENLYYESAAVAAGGKTGEALVYNKRYMNTGARAGEGRILFYLDRERMLRFFAPLEYRDKGFVYMTDSAGRAILEDFPADGDVAAQIKVDAFTGNKGYARRELNGEEFFLTWYRSEDRGWICIEGVPVSDLLAVAGQFRGMMLLLLVMAGLVGIVLVFLVSRKLAEPLIEIGNVLGREGRMPIEEFVGEIKMLVERNSVLVERMQQQVSVMRTEAFYKFLTGECRNAEETEEILDKIGMRKDASHYVILLVSCNDINLDACLEDISAQKVYLENIIREQRCVEIQDIYHIDFARMVIFMTFGEENARRVREKAEELIGAVKETIGKEAFYSISVGGDVVENVLKLPAAFVHSQKALNIPQNVFGTHKIQWYERARQYLDMEHYEFPAAGKNVPLQSLVLADKVKKYIHENYSDSQLSLSSVGEEFCITEVYLSKLFKQATGENFSKYVEGIRMEKAKELMEQKKKTSEIADMVGYNSPQVFRRAWKRYYGDTP